MSKLALIDLEHRLLDALSDALSNAECARLEFEARLATALAAEERLEDRARGQDRPKARKSERVPLWARLLRAD
jgi:hypothetical protein